MKKYSSILRLTWSIAYVILAIFVIRGSIDTSRFWAAHASTQDPRKSIEEAFSVEPQIRLSKAMVGNVERRLKEEFDESDDWPRRLSLEVQSLATKPIVYLEINLNFPDTRATGSLMSYPVKLGIRPDLNVPRENAPLRLMPQEKKIISVRNQYESLKQFIVRRHPMSDIRKIQVEIGFIIFDDGTAWAGEYLKADPSKPGRYVPTKLTSPI